MSNLKHITPNQAKVIFGLALNQYPYNGGVIVQVKKNHILITSASSRKWISITNNDKKCCNVVVMKDDKLLITYNQVVIYNYLQSLGYDLRQESFSNEWTLPYETNSDTSNDLLYQRMLMSRGSEYLTMKAMEECGELTQALSKHHLNNSLQNFENLAQEIGDVEIAIASWKAILSELASRVVFHKNNKLARLRKKYL